MAGIQRHTPLSVLRDDWGILMPTDPLEIILYRELAVVSAKSIIDIACPLLRELVNYGSNALVRCATSGSDKENEDLAVLSLYRHMLEMTDGIEVLVAQSCAMPAIPLLRSSFEALISLEYIVEDNAKYVSRSLAWLVGYLHQRITMYELLDPTIEKGKEYQEALRLDKSVQNLELPPTQDIGRSIDNLRNLLASPQLQVISQEYTSQKQKRWYRLCGGPNDLRTLAYHVGRSAQYDWLYRYWSRVSHGHNFAPFIARTSEGGGAIRPIRDADELKNVANFAANFMLAGTMTLIKKFRPGEEIRTWYERDVRPMYTEIFSREPPDQTRW